MLKNQFYTLIFLNSFNTNAMFHPNTIFIWYIIITHHNNVLADSLRWIGKSHEPSPYFDLLILFFVSNYLKDKWYHCLNGLIKEIVAKIKPHLLLYIKMLIKLSLLIVYPWAKVPLLMVSMATDLIIWYLCVLSIY